MEDVLYLVLIVVLNVLGDGLHPLSDHARERGVLVDVCPLAFHTQTCVCGNITDLWRRGFVR